MSDNEVAPLETAFGVDHHVTRAQAPDRPAQDGGPELVQLLDARGGARRTTPSSTATSTTADELRGFYRDMVLIRRIDTEATALQRHGELGIWAQPARPGGRPDRRRPRAAPPGLRLPDLPRARRRLVPRRRPAATCSACSAGSTTAAGTPTRTTSASTRSSSAPRPCTPPATPWASSATATSAPATRDRDAAVIAYFGDGATSQGDVNEAFIFAAVLQRPGGLLLPEQPVGHLRADRAPDPHPALPARAAASASPASGSTATTCWRSYAVTKAALAARPRRPGPHLRRGLHLPDGCAHHHRRPDPLPLSATRSSTGSSRTRSSGSSVYLRRNGLVDDDVLRRRRRRGRASSAHHLREGCKALPDPEAAGRCSTTSTPRSTAELDAAARAASRPTSTASTSEGAH